MSNIGAPVYSSQTICVQRQRRLPQFGSSRLPHFYTPTPSFRCGRLVARMNIEHVKIPTIRCTEVRLNMNCWAVPMRKCRAVIDDDQIERLARLFKPDVQFSVWNPRKGREKMVRYRHLV